MIETPVRRKREDLCRKKEARARDSLNIRKKDISGLILFGMSAATCMPDGDHSAMSCKELESDRHICGRAVCHPNKTEHILLFAAFHTIKYGADEVMITEKNQSLVA